MSVSTMVRPRLLAYTTRDARAAGRAAATRVPCCPPIQCQYLPLHGNISHRAASRTNIASERVRAVMGGYESLRFAVGCRLPAAADTDEDSMKCTSLRYLAADRHSAEHTGRRPEAATSQPGVSKQIKLLGTSSLQIFVREGRNLTRITRRPAVIERALRILQEAQSIRDLSTELRDEGAAVCPGHDAHAKRATCSRRHPEFRGSFHTCA